MRVAIIGFTRNGCLHGKKIERYLESKQEISKAYGKCKVAKECQVEVLEESLQEWTEKMFATCDALVFIGATGIAVRSIAPFVKSKLTDPAVLVMDEQANYVISLLSGHIGGANDLAREVAELLGATEVITTATDVNGKFAVDSFAKKEGLIFIDKVLAKEVSAAVIEGNPIGITSDFPITDSLPKELSLKETGELGICISLDEKKKPYEKTFQLFPKIVVLGVGCRKGVSKEQIEEIVGEACEKHGLSFLCIRGIASIDLKKDEKGLLAFCQSLGVELKTYTAEELKAVESDEMFGESSFVKEVTGVGNVCERSALKLSGQRRLLEKKYAKNGVTVAIAIEPYTLHFS